LASAAGAPVTSAVSISPYLAAGIHAGAGAIAGGINAAIGRENIGLGMLTGGISGGIGKFAGGFLPDGFGYQFAGRSAIGGITGGIAAEMYGGSFRQGFGQGARTAAYGFLFNDVLHRDWMNMMKDSGYDARTSQQNGYWKRVWDNFRITNEAIPGILAPTGMSFFTSGATAETLGSMTFLQWAQSGFGGASSGGTSFTVAETGLIVSGSALTNYVLVGTSYQTGVFIGSMINAAIPQ